MPGTAYEVPCDDKGRNGLSYLRIVIGPDSDVHVMMHDQEELDGVPSVFPCIRIRTMFGGGRNLRTHQALLWLTDAIRRDNEENKIKRGS